MEADRELFGLLQGVNEFRGDLLLLGKRDAVEERECQGTAGDGFGYGERSRARTGMGAPGRLKVDGSEVAAGGDSAGGKRSLNLVAVDLFWQANYVNKPADGALG
jgi:hypothetical protein